MDSRTHPSTASRGVAGEHDRPGGLRAGLATIALETGHCLRGRWFGGAPRGGLGTADPAPRPIGGEVVFHTGMTGYQEILTDPSYAGQIVVFTASHIGNYGIHAGEDESAKIHPTAIVVRDHCHRTFHQQADRDLGDVLRRAGVPGLSEVDTRALTTILREHGTSRGVIGVGRDEDLVAAARALPPMHATNWVDAVTCAQPWSVPARGAIPAGGPFEVAVLDFGVKRSILERLRDEGCALTVYPARTSSQDLLGERVGRRPDGVFLSNGPGDPATLDPLVQTIREVLAAGVPVFGICLGHQLLGRAIGARTAKLPFGHHGANHPVRRESDHRVEITSHNHNYAVLPDSIDTTRVRITHRSLNDGCLEGMELIGRPVYSVQYHPEAAPGPRDGKYLFHRFAHDMTAYRAARKGS